jgi:hypothetical protein
MRLPGTPPGTSMEEFTKLMKTISVDISKFFTSFRRDVSRVGVSTVNGVEYNPDERGLNDMVWCRLIESKMVFAVSFNTSHLIVYIY